MAASHKLLNHHQYTFISSPEQALELFRTRTIFCVAIFTLLFMVKSLQIFSLTA
jgi:hypothetical protein